MTDTPTVAEIIGDAPAPVVATRIDAPRHPGQATFPAPGIYFDLPEEIYHSVHAASASGIKHLSISSMDYWAMSILNQEREGEEETKDAGKLTPKQLGQAYHCFICEGPVVFAQRYVVALDRDKVKMDAAAAGKPLCVTIADIRAEIDRLGGKAKGTGKDALIDQLLDFDAGAFIWDRLVSEHGRANAGKLFISAKLFRRIAIAHAMIAGDPQLKGAFTGGHSEVSIFWYDEATGIPMKARLDYLKMNHLIDLKSFSNMGGKPIQRAIDMAISNNKYFIPVVVYLEAIAAAKKLVRDSKGACARVITGVMVGGTMTGRDPDEALRSWLWVWAHQDEPEVLFVFQQTGIAPVTRGRIMPTGSSYMITQHAVQYLKAKWARCAVAYGVDPWVDFEPVVATEDESLTWAATDFGDVS